MSKQPNEALAKKFHAALAAMNAGDLKRSERLLQAVRDRLPQHFETLMILGALYGQQSRFDQALPLLERAVKCRPDNPDAQFNLGLALSQVGMKDRSVECYRRTLALVPNHLDALNN